MEEQQENIPWEILYVQDTRYKTLLTKKFRERKHYEPANPKLLLAFIPGTIQSVFVKPGQKVKKGDKLVGLEAMKMINEILAPFNGVVAKVNVKVGERVPKNEVLVELK
jgi:biotin carboxyl carrier protein